MSKIECFEDIEAWQLGRELVKAVYAASKKGEFARDYALKDQIRRAAVSICSNIAEGFERDGDKEFRQALSQSKGSCGEVRSQLYHALDEGYISEAQFNRLREDCRTVSSKLSRFMSYLRTSSYKGTKFKER
jgi:four helix bundle protein